MMPLKLGTAGAEPALHTSWRGAAGSRIVLALALLGTFAACGKKGIPTPPLRIIPNPTKDLAVMQRGNQLVLRLSYPQTTTAGAKLPGLAAVEVAAMTRPVAAAAAPPVVDAREFDAAGKPVATLSGAELQSPSRRAGGGALPCGGARAAPRGPAASPAPGPPERRFATSGLRRAPAPRAAWSAVNLVLCSRSHHRRPRGPCRRAAGAGIPWRGAPPRRGSPACRLPAGSREPQLCDALATPPPRRANT